VPSRAKRQIEAAYGLAVAAVAGGQESESITLEPPPVPEQRRAPLAADITRHGHAQMVIEPSKLARFAVTNVDPRRLSRSWYVRLSFGLIVALTCKPARPVIGISRLRGPAQGCPRPSRLAECKF